jgi:hypothetical protein
MRIQTKKLIHMYSYIRLCIWLHKYTYIYTHKWVFTNLNIRVDAYFCICHIMIISICMHIWENMHIYGNLQIYTNIYVSEHVYEYIFTFKYIYGAYLRITNCCFFSPNMKELVSRYSCPGPIAHSFYKPKPTVCHQSSVSWSITSQSIRALQHPHTTPRWLEPAVIILLACILQKQHVRHPCATLIFFFRLFEIYTQ